MSSRKAGRPRCRRPGCPAGPRGDAYCSSMCAHVDSYLRRSDQLTDREYAAVLSLEAALSELRIAEQQKKTQQQTNTQQATVIVDRSQTKDS